VAVVDYHEAGMSERGFASCAVRSSNLRLATARNESRAAFVISRSSSGPVSGHVRGRCPRNRSRRAEPVI
jgi:hypothetical protein